MMNRRGKWGSAWWIFIIIIILVSVFAALSDDFDIFSKDVFTANYDKGLVGYEDSDVFGEKLSEGQRRPFTILNFIFGKVPQHLIETTNSGVGAGIVMLAIWLMFFLIFADILKLFSTFSPTVNWIIAGLFVIIISNLNFIPYISIYFLTIMAVFGAFSVLFAVGSIFVLFVFFHFGGMDIRNWILQRRAQDAALRSVAGGKIVASGATVLADVAAAAKKAEEEAKK